MYLSFCPLPYFPYVAVAPPPVLPPPAAHQQQRWQQLSLVALTNRLRRTDECLMDNWRHIFETVRVPFAPVAPHLRWITTREHPQPKPSDPLRSDDEILLANVRRCRAAAFYLFELALTALHTGHRHVRALVEVLRTAFPPDDSPDALVWSVERTAAQLSAATGLGIHMVRSTLRPLVKQRLLHENAARDSFGLDLRNLGQRVAATLSEGYEPQQPQSGDFQPGDPEPLWQQHARRWAAVREHFVCFLPLEEWCSRRQWPVPRPAPPRWRPSSPWSLTAELDERRRARKLQQQLQLEQAEWEQNARERDCSSSGSGGEETKAEVLAGTFDDDDSDSDCADERVWRVNGVPVPQSQLTEQHVVEVTVADCELLYAWLSAHPQQL